MVLKRLRDVNANVKLAKCQFFKNKVEFLGYTLRSGCIEANEEKVKDIMDSPSPSDKKELRSFLGMMNYQERFIPGLQSIAAPLYDLLANNAKWVWSKRQQEVFLRLKETLQDARSLQPYRREWPLILACDASDIGP
ncbi:hypothetical protein ACOME3_004493 [Neoechinorhynchus agilis]